MGRHAPTASQLLMLAVVCIVAAAALWQAVFVGFLASDDGSYLLAARHWLHDFPFVGNDHWSLRHTVVLPLAAIIALFGEGEHVIALEGLIYQVGILVVAGYFVLRVAGPMAAVAVIAALASLPVLAIQSTIVNDDLAELFFVALSLWLFLSAVEHGGRTSPLLGAGAAAGLAMISRESSAALLLAYGILFLSGFGMARWRYWLMAGPFLVIELGEMLYYGFFVGDPFHRIRVLLDVVQLDQSVSLPTIGFDRRGVLRVGPIVDPFIMVFSRIDFGLIFYWAIPAVLWVFTARRERGAPSRTARVMLLAGVTWLAFNAVALRTSGALPRYYAMTAYAAAVVAAIWFGQVAWPRRPRRALAGLALVLAGNAAGLYLANKDPLFGPHALAAYLATSDVPRVTIDPELAARSEILLKWSGEWDRVSTAPPQAGDLVFHDPWIFDQPWQLTPKTAASAAFAPKPNWQLYWRREEDRKYIGVLVERLGLDRFLPAPILSRLNRPRPPVTIYRVPGSG